MEKQLCQQIDSGIFIAYLLLEVKSDAPSSVIKMPGIRTGIQCCHIGKDMGCFDENTCIEVLWFESIAVAVLFHQLGENPTNDDVVPGIGPVGNGFVVVQTLYDKWTTFFRHHHTALYPHPWDKFFNLR